MGDGRWHDVGPLEAFTGTPVSEVRVDRLLLAITWNGSELGAISGVCNHVAGPLGQGRLDGDYVVCPWHGWKFHRASGEGEPGFEEDRVPRHDVRVEAGRVLVNLDPGSARGRKPHARHPLARPVRREPGPIRMAGISTTAMDRGAPRFSGSDALLEAALAHAAGALGSETRLLKLNDLSFRACEGYYSKAARACTWPCSITQMDPADQLDRVYEAVVHWADVVLVATPIRWGAPSSLYFRMAERFNCIQNQVTTHDRVLIRNKVAGFIVVGGQDNVQAVAGQMLGFFAELGFLFPQFPFVAHSRGWTAEDMERNVAILRDSVELREGASHLAARCVALAGRLLESEPAERVARGGRKAQRLGPAAPPERPT
jgi:nitrite reductase/ring-hydroxylating ferredoxin subunit/multimeric flavodoxin WrbA